jgi:hypothetical protein
MSQNVSPGAACVIIATVNFGPDAATPAAGALESESAFSRPPDDVHPANTTHPAASATTAPTTRREPNIINNLSKVTNTTRR